MQLDKTENLWYNDGRKVNNVHKKNGPGRRGREGWKGQKIRGHIMYPYHIGEKGQKTGAEKKSQKGVDKGGGVWYHSVGPGKGGPTGTAPEKAG